MLEGLHQGSYNTSILVPIWQGQAYMYANIFYLYIHIARSFLSSVVTMSWMSWRVATVWCGETKSIAVGDISGSHPQSQRGLLMLRLQLFAMNGALDIAIVSISRSWSFVEINCTSISNENRPVRHRRISCEIGCTKVVILEIITILCLTTIVCPP